MLVKRFVGLIGLVVLAALPMAPALGQTGALCAAIDNEGERLTCYDAIFRGAVGEGGLSVTFQSEQLIPARPSGRQPATITVMCAAGALTTVFGFADNTMSALGRDAGITLQVDLQSPRSRTLSVDSTNTALVIDNTADTNAFLDSLAGANNLTVRVTPSNSRSLRVRFSLAGLLSAVEPVRAACS